MLIEKRSATLSASPKSHLYLFDVKLSLIHGCLHQRNPHCIRPRLFQGEAFLREVALQHIVLRRLPKILAALRSAQVQEPLFSCNPTFQRPKKSKRLSPKTLGTFLSLLILNLDQDGIPKATSGRLRRCPPTPRSPSWKCKRRPTICTIFR